MAFQARGCSANRAVVIVVLTREVKIIKLAQVGIFLKLFDFFQSSWVGNILGAGCIGLEDADFGLKGQRPFTLSLLPLAAELVHPFFECLRLMRLANQSQLTINNVLD